jgi:hypothetical protein
MNIAEQLQTIADNVPKVYQAGYDDGAAAGGGGGGDSYYDTFWDAYQDNGNRNMYIDGFIREGWNEVTYNPKYPIVGGTYGFQSMYSNSRIVDTKVETILRGTGSLKATFNGCGYLKRIHSLVLEVPVTDADNGFNNCNALEEINISCVGNGCIDADLNLSACSKLSSGSVDNIINALKDLRGQTAKTITFHKDMGSKVTPDQKQAIFAKNWEQVY